MTVLVFLDSAFEQGRVVDASRPQLMATDQGATRGDGVFESLLAVDGGVRKEQAHLARLASSAGALRLEIPDAEAWSRAIRTALTEYAASTPDRPEAVVKLIATRGVEGAGPTAWVAVSPVPAATRRQRETGVAVLLLDRGYDSTVAQRAPWLLLGAKTLSYAVNMAAIRHAKEHGADDVIFTSSDGKVLEGPTSTVLTARHRGGVKTLVTPQLESGILPGTSQGALFKAAAEAGWQLGYGPLEPKDLLEADAVWLISSIRLLTPVTAIDGAAIPTAPELTAELAALVDRFL
ncbi:aminodeoxychorismate lyase [Arthrobacter crusticola]|uniref:Aminodeoxychorismate lyase n=1 Tax=Arthrobacter crusticola TaxID=2547960 RepID=A0A4R5TW85_9MICC|nr:aminodeoxychorismate lyase [Arthrobacter crusticola]TDK25401.1 aminodeoxychorismate lyase [Arthrobacter crusticola]